MEYFGLDSKPNQDEIGLLYPTRKLLKTTYRQLILIHHPDKQGGDTEEFQRIDAAYKELLALYDDDKEGGKFKYLNESYNEEKLKSDGTSAQPTAGGDTAGTKKTSSSSSSGGGPYTDYVNSNNQNNTQGTNSTNKVPRASAAQSTPKSNKTNDNDADTNGNKPFDPFNTQYQSPPPPSDFDPFASPIPPHQQKFDPNKFKRKGPQQQNPNGPNSNDPFGSVNFWANQQSQTGQSGMQSGNNSSSSSTSYIPPNSPFHGIPEPQSPKPTTAPSGPTIKRKDSKQLHVVEVLLTGLRAVQKSGTYRVEVALDGRAQTQRRWTEFPEQAVQNTKLGCYFQPPEHLTFFR